MRIVTILMKIINIVICHSIWTIESSLFDFIIYY